MHNPVKAFVKECRQKYGTNNSKVLEIGSLDVNGTIREYFKENDYIGIDMRAGKNVDYVMNGNNINFVDNSFDIILYLETMEHDMQFWRTLEEIQRLLKKDGLLILTTRGINFKYHPHPKDYFRVTKDFFTEYLGQFYKIIKFEDDPEASGIFFLGKKL